MVANFILVLFTFVLIFLHPFGVRAQSASHPFMLVRSEMYADLRAKAAREPWSGIKTRAVNECRQRIFPAPCNGNLNTFGNEYPALNSSAYCMRAIMSACSLAYIVDPTNSNIYLDKIITTLPKWEEILIAQSGADDGTPSWSTGNLTDATAAYFNTVLAVDILHDELASRSWVGNRINYPGVTLNNQLQYAEFLMEQEYNHFWGINKPVFNFVTHTPEALAYHAAPNNYPPAREAALILWRIYKGEFNASDVDSKALLFGGMMNNNFIDQDHDGDNTEGFLPEMGSRINESGTYTEGPGYAYAGWGLDRDERSHLIDILEFTGKDKEFEIDFYTNPRYVSFYEWLYGYASTPFGVMTSFSDTHAFRQLTDDGHGGNAWTTSSHIGQAGKFGAVAGGYAAWKNRGDPQQGRLLNYLMYTDGADSSLRPDSKIFPNGGGFFLSKPVDDKALYGALWNVKEPTDTAVFHIRKDMNAIYIAGYGAPLLMNGGFCGASSPAGADGCYGVDENSTGYNFSGNYLSHRIVSNNSALVNYSLGNYLDPNDDRDLGNYGNGVKEGFTAEGMDYVSANKPVGGGNHERSFFMVHPEDQINGYFLVHDELTNIGSGPAHLVWHPNAASRTVSTNLVDYDTTAFRKMKGDNNVGLGLFFATSPQSIQFYRGIIATSSNVAAAVPEYFFNTYNVGTNGRKAMLTVLFPHDSNHIKPVMTQLIGSGYTGVKIDHSTINKDYAFESDGSAVVQSSGFEFEGKFMQARTTNNSMSSYAVKSAVNFSANSGSRGFSSINPVSMYLNDKLGVAVVSSSSVITLKYPGISGVKVNGNLVTPVSTGNGWVRINLSAGESQIEVVSNGMAIPGDTNNDGRVDGIDYVNWLNRYNSTSTNGSNDGDFNTDGRIDGLDYVIWLNNYGI